MAPRNQVNNHKQEDSFSWWDKQNWKPKPPADAESHRPGHKPDREMPQGDKKWRLNNPKKRESI